VAAGIFAIPGMFNDAASGFLNGPNNVYAGTRTIVEGARNNDSYLIATGLTRATVGVLDMAGGSAVVKSAFSVNKSVNAGANSRGYTSGAENVAQYELLKAEYRALYVNSQIGIPATRSTNPMSPVLERDALGNEIYYRSMSSRAYEEFQRTGKMAATTETSISPSFLYAAGYRGTTIQITVEPGTSSLLQDIGIATNKPAYLEFPSMSTRNGEWMFTNARFKGEGGQMSTQLGQGAALDIFNKNIVQQKRVK